MKKKILAIIFSVLCAFCMMFGVACNNGDKTVANAELDEYNQIVSQMKEAFSQIGKEGTSSLTAGAKQSSATATKYANVIEQEDQIAQMFSLMENDTNKKKSEDMDYYAYGIDFSTMTARIAGYGANNFFKESNFYDVNILMDYGADTLINACVKKDGDIIKTYLYTQYDTTQDGLQKEYNYTEIKFTSKTDFKLVVVDYTFDAQNVLVSNTMIYASSQKEFFLISGMADETDSAIVFFDKGDEHDAYEIGGKNSQTVKTLYAKMLENFALSQEDKNLIQGLYQNQTHTITYAQVMEAKKELGILLDLSDAEFVEPVGFISNKNAEDLIGRKTLQEFYDDQESVVVDAEGKKLTIPSEFKYLSGSIQFHADIDTLIIPSTVQGVVIFNSLRDYTLMDDSLCMFEPSLEGGPGFWKDWGGTLVADLNTFNNFQMGNERPFKKYVLLDENGQPTNETQAFRLDEMGNLWIKGSQGQSLYLWGFTSEPNATVDTWNLPSPEVIKKGDNAVEVKHYECDNFFQALRNVNKLDQYVSQFEHIVLDTYYVSERMDNLGYYQEGWYLPNTNFLRSYYADQKVYGPKWDLDSLTINGIQDGTRINLVEMFCTSVGPDETPTGQGFTVCQVEIENVILNGDFSTIKLYNGYYECTLNQGGMGDSGDGGFSNVMGGNGKITATYAIGENIVLNGRENAKFDRESMLFGQKVLEIDGTEINLPTYLDLEKIIIKETVTNFGINESLFTYSGMTLPEDRKLTVEFENILGIEYGRFYIKDLMDENSARVNKVIFDISASRMQRLIASLEYDADASWLSSVVNSGKFVIAYGQTLDGEEEFFTNYEIGVNGYVSLKTDSQITEVVINDQYLDFVKKLTGKTLDKISLAYHSENQIKLTLDVSKEYFDDNGQNFPNISSNQVTIELSSKMLNYENLHLILDGVIQSNGSTLKVNGTKQELVDCFGNLEEQYLSKLLYVEGGNFGEIIFLNEQGEVIEKLQNSLNGKTITYNDGRVEIKITYSTTGNVYWFKDLQIPENVVENSTSYRYEGTGWGVNLGLLQNGYDEYSYVIQEGENQFTRNIRVPKYEISILYYDSYDDSGYPNLVYKNEEDGPKYIVFSITDLPEQITIS